MTGDKNLTPKDDEKGRGLPVYRPNGQSLGILFSNVTAIGASGSSQTVSDLPQILVDILTWPVQMALKLVKGSPRQARNIVQDVMVLFSPTMLVLGRPGAGCSTVLRVLSNQRQSYHVLYVTENSNRFF